MNPRLIVAVVSIFTLASVTFGQPITIAPGRDYWVCTQPSKLVFGPGGLPPIPAEFFGPGSEPFTGEVRLASNPASPSLPADTIIERTAASAPIDVGQYATIPIELISLELKSVKPIQVGDSFFDVFFGLEPGSTSSGQATITRTHPTGGVCGFSAQFSPRIRFREVASPLDLDLPAPGPFVIETLRTVGFPRFSTTPIVPTLPLQGPNCFPIDPTTTNPLTTTPGVCISWAPVFDSPADCNANGMDDTIDILLGNAPDANLNGVPDFCELSVKTVYQDSFPDSGTGWLQRHSSRGEMRVSVIDPPEGEVWWLSAAVSGRWIIYNFPIHEQTGEGKLTEHTVPFDLGNVPGVEVVDIQLVELSLSSTGPLPIPVNLPPLGPVIFDAPVLEHPIRIGSISGGLPLLPLLPMFGQDFIFFDADGLPKEIARRRGVPGVSEQTNECGPGATARSLAWMDDQYCLGVHMTPQSLVDLLSFEMEYSNPEGVENEGAVLDGTHEAIAQLGLSNSLSAELCEADGVNDDDEVFDALQRGCDVVGLIYFLNPDGTDRLGHAITVLGGSRCGDRVVISFADDCLGGDSQQDGIADDPSHVKGAGLVPRSVADPRLNLPGYGNNRWAGFIKICPTSKVQTDAANKWNTTASGTPAGGGLGDLIDNIVGGSPVTEQDRMNLLAWACNLVDTLEFARHTINQQCTPSPAGSIVLEMIGRARHAKSKVWVYLRSGNPADLMDAAEELGPAFDAFMAGLLARLDCNQNGIDDTLEIARGDAHDANHDCIIDSCECLADWNHDGVRDVPDIFAFLTAWFAGDADVNGDGVTSVPDIFAFLALWFAGCPD